MDLKASGKKNALAQRRIDPFRSELRDGEKNYAARRVYRWWGPPTSGNSTTLPW